MFRNSNSQGGAVTPSRARDGVQGPVSKTLKTLNTMTRFLGFRQVFVSTAEGDIGEARGKSMRSAVPWWHMQWLAVSRKTNRIGISKDKMDWGDVVKVEPRKSHQEQDHPGPTCYDNTLSAKQETTCQVVECQVWFVKETIEITFIL